ADRLPARGSGPRSVPVHSAYRRSDAARALLARIEKGNSHMKIRAVLLLFALTLLPAFAETPGEDPLASHVFPPDLVMAHQEEIGLTDRQRDAIKGEIQKVQSRFLDLQFQMQKEMQKLVSL